MSSSLLTHVHLLAPLPSSGPGGILGVLPAIALKNRYLLLSYPLLPAQLVLAPIPSHFSSSSFLLVLLPFFSTFPSLYSPSPSALCCHLPDQSFYPPLLLALTSSPASDSSQPSLGLLPRFLLHLQHPKSLLATSSSFSLLLQSWERSPLSGGRSQLEQARQTSEDEDES
eukprot:563381-Hanusia_phi.AAC.1